MVHAVLARITARPSDLVRLCSWVEADLEPEYLGGEIEHDVCRLYICMASEFLSEPVKEIDDIEDGIKKCRAKRPRLLYNAWKAATMGDQAAFDKAFKEAMQHLRRTIKRHKWLRIG